MESTYEERLTPYLPRLAHEWAEGDAAFRVVDGSLVFVDISGFTALSERLARRGRVGAEELTETLSSVFADLLTSAYAAGGSLLKFGGDALLILFDGDAHSTRAGMTAMRMRTALGDRGPIRTVGGAIRLRMSVGVHSGPVHFFRVGSSHKELLVTGPGASTVCAMESTAVAGQIMVSPETAAALPRRLLGEVNGPGVLLKRSRVDADAAGYPQVQAAAAGLVSAIPVALREALTAGVEPEHRLVTIAFVHFDGIDGFLERKGAEATAKALDQLVTEVQDAADGERVTFLGSDLDHDGGKLILVGGAPRAFGDDEGRVLRAVRRIVDAETELRVRVGVNRGHVFVGEVGPSYRRTYTVMGDTVNLAARLMAKAAPGEIIATGAVLDNAQTMFGAELLPPFHVKGKSEAISAFSVGPIKGRRRRAGADPLPFVGRAQELAVLTGAWGRARGGHGSFISVFGDGGIGKSRLVREFVGHADDVRTISAFCETYQATTPYFALRYLLRGALGISSDAPTERALRNAVERLDPELLRWLPLIGAVAAIDVDTTPEVEALEQRFRRARTQQTIVDVMTLALTNPVVLVVDDAHWLDELSGEVLVALAAAGKQRPWLILLAGRVETDSYAAPHEVLDNQISLEPLDRSAANALLVSADQSASLRPDQRNAILHRSGGNPLFLEQLAARTESSDGAELPDSLETLIAAEIDALPATDRSLVRLAAVLGPIFDAELLRELVEAQSLEQILSGRVARLIERVSDTTLRFRNQTFRDVAYQTLSFGRRRDLHSRALAAIEASTPTAADEAEALSYHALHARDYPRCWRYSRLAATRASENDANVEAATLYERALDAGAQLAGELDAELGETWEQLGVASLDAGMLDRAKRAFDKARAVGPQVPLFQARLCKLEALTAMHRGQPASVTRWIKRGLDFVGAPADPKELEIRSELQTMQGELLHRRRQNLEALKWCDRAERDALAAESRSARARALTIRGLALLDMGRVDELDCLEDALRLWETVKRRGVHGQATVATILGAAAYYSGRWDEAAALSDRAQRDFERAGDVITAGYGLCNVADILIDQGRGAEVVDGLVEVIRVWRSVGHPDPIPGALVNLGRCALESGDLKEALARFSEARKLTPASAGARVDTDYWLAECALRNGDAENALITVNAALRADPAEGSTFTARLHRLRGLALATAGRFNDAIDAENTSLRIARERAAPYDVAQAILALDACLASEGSRAEESLRNEAHEILTRLGVRDVQLPLPA